MKPTQNIRIQYLKVILAVVVMIILTALVGWQLIKESDEARRKKNTASRVAENSSTVKSLISYSLPKDWSEAECASEIHIGPGASVCNTGSPAPIIVSIDPQNNTDCSQLDGAQGVQKHTCRSVFIDGRQSLQAETVKDGTTTVAHYVNTGNGVVKIAYIYADSNDYQPQYDQLVSSIDVRN